MITIRGLVHYVGPPLKEPLTPLQRLNLNDDGSLTRVFREALLKGPEAFTVHLQIPPYPLLHCNFARCGQAAGVANWWREKGTEAVTAFLPGIDQDDEDIIEQALASKPYPITLHRWHEIFKAERPVYATFLLTPVAAKDRLLTTAADALAFTFFSILGVVEDDRKG